MNNKNAKYDEMRYDTLGVISAHPTKSEQKDLRDEIGE